ncbi:hypothetical protein [Paenibacillus sp. BR1-192]|uniref:hypothetical protein n=1 Tax=Paenibacillus sp. BR1-192 TaxID=3032287 RepID=UPI00240E22AB|nr:hypothetical protein [Paenibacillus sp. BR1-192]WFB60596.1 hypothetical protein P0X86_10485 [Paenibacillus sp. BR1-192]
MNFIKHQLTVEDIKTLTEKELENFHESILWGDPEPGESFYDFSTDEVHTITEVRSEGNSFFLVYEGGKTDDWDTCFPLLDVGQLLDLLSFETNIEVRSWGSGWLVVYEDQFFKVGRNELIDVLFKALKMKISK